TGTTATAARTTRPNAVTLGTPVSGATAGPATATVSTIGTTGTATTTERVVPVAAARAASAAAWRIRAGGHTTDGAIARANSLGMRKTAEAVPAARASVVSRAFRASPDSPAPSPLSAAPERAGRRSVRAAEAYGHRAVRTM